MNRFFNIDNGFFQFLDKMANLIWLNILWLVCCIPIVTIGASTTAMYYVTLKMVRDEESYITRSFFKSFVGNLRQATGIWILFLAFSAVLYVDFSIMRLEDSPVFKVITVILYIMIILAVLTLTYVFPLLSRFDNTILNTLKNALLLSVLNIPWTALLIVLTVVPVLALLQFLVYLVPVALLIGGSGVAFAKSMVYVRVFDKLMPADNSEETGETIE